MDEETKINDSQNSSSLPPNQNRTYDEENNSSKLLHPEFSIDTLNSKSINILGFDLYFDDIIILALILFLLQEEKKDYLLIGVLGLMFFDFSIDKLSSFEPLKKLLGNIT
ncbi:MAG: hypothetical protein IJ809_00835 [Clostridia bacterium]|nr:hypothetical protein [Clostridia bacterium]